MAGVGCDQAQRHAQPLCFFTRLMTSHLGTLPETRLT